MREKTGWRAFRLVGFSTGKKAGVLMLVFSFSLITEQRVVRFKVRVGGEKA